MIYGGNLMNEFQKLYIERKKQFEQSEGDKESVVALYNLKKYLNIVIVRMNYLSKLYFIIVNFIKM